MTCRFAFAAILSTSLGAVALAQPAQPTNPNEPYPNPPPPTQPAPAPQPDSTTTVVTPPPTVIVNPPAPSATVVQTDPGYETVEDYWNAPVFASGAVTFAASYGAAVIAAASLDQDKRDRWGDRLYLPVVGPWLALNDYGSNCPIAEPQCDDQTTTKVLLVADGVFQAAGVVTMVTGLLSPTYHRRPIRYTYDTKVHVRPGVVGRGGSGLHVFGRF